MKTALTLYRVLATVVGISIILLILVALPLNELHHLNASLIPKGSGAQKLGDDINLYLGTAHGFIYLLFLVVAFALSRVARWTIGFTVVTLLCGTVPFLSFWAEARAIRDVETKLGPGPITAT